MSGRIVDVIVTARDFYNNYPNIGTDLMGVHCELPPSQQMQFGVKVHEPSGNTLATIYDAVIDYAIKTREGKPFSISIIPVPETTVSVAKGDDGQVRRADKIMRSILTRYESHAEIRYVDNLNPCWTRFVICKELAHLLMDDDSHGTRAKDVHEQLTMAYQITSQCKDTDELSSEQFAWLLAAELMLPISSRQQLINYKNNGVQEPALARGCWIPSAILNMIFDSPYGNISNGF